MRRIVPLLVSLAVLSLVNAPGCGGGCREEDRTLLSTPVPAAPVVLPAAAPAATGTAPLTALVAGRAPLSADSVFVLRSLRSALTETGLQTALATDAGRMLVAAVEAQLGFSPFDLDGLREAGLSPDAPLVMVTEGESLVLLYAAASDPAKAIGIVRRWGADNGVPFEEVALEPAEGAATGLRLAIPGEGETWLLAAEGAVLFGFEESGAERGVRAALADARTQGDGWRERLALFAPHEPAEALAVAWATPATEADAANLLGMDGGAPNALVQTFMDGMTGAATFYEEADNFTVLALAGNGVRLSVRDRLTDGAAALRTLATAVDVRSTLALVPDEPIALVVETVRHGDVAPIVEFVGGLQPAIGNALAGVGRAWEESGVGATMWDRPDRLRLLGFASWGPDGDADVEMDMTFFVELADDAAATRAAAERLFTALGETAPVPGPTRSAWEDYPVWYLARSADPDAAVCTVLERLLVCAGRPERLKRVLARERQRERDPAPRHDLVMYWRADLQRFLSAFPLGVLGVPSRLQAAIGDAAASIGPVTFVERLDASGASIEAHIEGRDRPVIGAVLEAGFALAGLF